MALNVSKVPRENSNKVCMCYLWKKKTLLKYSKKI